jgi:hypothetical protein
MKLPLLITSLLFITSAFATEPKPVEAPLTLQNGTVEFFALGKPSMLKIHGVNSKLEGTLTPGKDQWGGSFKLKPVDFETGMKIRDEHLRERVFEVTKFETSEFKFDQLKVPFVKTGSAKDIDFKGTLTLHGVKKEITGKLELDRSADKAQFDAKFEINLTDFSITPPEFMGMTIQNTVKVTVKGEAK